VQNISVLEQRTRYARAQSMNVCYFVHEFYFVEMCVLKLNIWQK